MTKVLIVYRATATEAISHLDEFVEKMDEFVEANPDYRYESSLKKVNNQWEVKVKVDRDERESTITT